MSDQLSKVRLAYSQKDNELVLIRFEEEPGFVVEARKVTQEFFTLLVTYLEREGIVSADGTSSSISIENTNTEYTFAITKRRVHPVN